MLAAALAFGAPVAAQTYPSKAVTVIMATAAGSSQDVMARVVTTRLQGRLGQPVVVENKPGAGVIIGTEALIKAAPDGYTIGSVSQAASNHHLLYKEPRFVMARDTAPLILLVESGYGLLVTAKLPVKSVTELVAMLRANPGKLNYGSAGLGTAPHIVGELFKGVTGTDVVHVPYKESPRALQAIVSGELELIFFTPNGAKPLVDAKTANLLAVTGRNREALMPQVPTMREAGIDLVSSLWFGLAAPAAMPRPMIMKLNQEINEVLKMPETKDKLGAMGMAALGGSPEDLARQIDEEAKSFGAVMERAKIPKQ